MMWDDVFNHTMHPYTEVLFNSLPNVNDRKSKLKPIPGLMPDPTKLPEGCAFAPRCPKCCEECTRQAVALKDIGDGHLVRCLFHVEG